MAPALTKRLPVFCALSILLLSPACSSSGTKDAIAVKGARSILAEWALINRQAAAGRLTRPYADGMRREALAQLAADAQATSDPQGPAGQAIARISRLPGDASPAALNAARLRLLAIENQLEPD